MHEGKKEGQIAADAFFFEDFSGLDAFPSGGDFDQDTFAGNAFLFIGRDQVTGFFDGSFHVKGQARVNLGGNTARNDLEDFEAEKNEYPVEDRVGKLGTGQPRVFEFGHRAFDERPVGRFFRSLEDERRIGSRVLGLVGFH